MQWVWRKRKLNSRLQLLPVAVLEFNLEVLKSFALRCHVFSPFSPISFWPHCYQFDNKYYKLDNNKKGKSLYMYVYVWWVLKTNSTRKRKSCWHKTSEKQIKFGLSFSFCSHSKFSLCNTNFFSNYVPGRENWWGLVVGEGCTKSPVCITWAWHCWGVVALITSVKMNFD